MSGTVKLENGTAVKSGLVEFYNAEHDVTARGKIRETGDFDIGVSFDDARRNVRARPLTSVELVSAQRRNGGNCRAA